MGVINKLLGRLKLYSDPTVTTQTTTVIQSDTTNSSIALVPNGTGAIIASIPDGTATGGNARGQYAVDLQRVRSANTKVAADYASYSTILNGQSNFVGQIYGTILGGNTNTVSFNSVGYSTVINGQSCTTSGNYSLAQGFQSNSGDSAIGLGYQSNATGAYSLSSGTGCTSSGQNSQSFGYQNQSTGINSFSHGSRSIAYLNTQKAHGANNTWGNPFYGLCQASELIPTREASLTTAATTVLSLDGTGTTNLIIPNGNNRAWNVQIDTIAVVTAITGTATGVSVGDCYRETKQLLFKRVGGTSSIVGTVDTTAVKNDISMPCTLTVTAGASQEMALTFAAPVFGGGGSLTIRVVSKVSLVEVAY